VSDPDVERYVIDSNIFDKIVDDGLTEAVTRLARAGRLVLISTHVQRDEIERVQDRKRLARLLEVPVEQVPTFGFVIGESRIGMARLGPTEPFETLRSGADRMTRTRDASSVPDHTSLPRCIVSGTNVRYPARSCPIAAEQLLLQMQASERCPIGGMCATRRTSRDRSC